MSNVLVTGGSGFVGSHTILQLLEKGHEVRATVRNLRREPEVRAMLQQGGMDAADRLTFAAADLERDDGWQDAVRGCDYVMHVASPFPATIPEDENELIIPAREGALRVLRAARDAGVRRVVMTSSFAAIGYGHPPQTTPFDEKRLDGPKRQRRSCVRQVKDDRRTGCMGFYRERRPRTRTLRDQSGWNFWSRAWRRSRDVRRLRETDDGRKDAGMPAHLLRRRRRPRRCRSAPARDGKRGGEGPALHCRSGRCGCVDRCGESASTASRRTGRKSAEGTASGLARATDGALESGATKRAPATRCHSTRE